MDTYESFHQELLDEYSNGEEYSPETVKLGDILYSYVENDRLVNFQLVPENFMRALVDVLKRMPEDDYYDIPEELTFIVETKYIAAQNIRLRASTEIKGHKIPKNYDIIIIFCTALNYPHNALVGLIAHEIAHSFVDGRDYKSDEDAVDERVVKWGFQEELQALQKHKEELESSPLHSEQPKLSVIGGTEGQSGNSNKG